MCCNQEFIAAGSCSGKVTIYESAQLFGQYSLKQFKHHDREINDMQFLKKENIHLLITTSSDTTVSIISLDELKVIFQFDLGKLALRHITICGNND